MPTGSYTHPLLGKVTFETEHRFWVRGDPIRFTSGFDPDIEVTSVLIPQLHDVPGSNRGKLRFHRKGHAQLQMAFADIERLGMMRFIRTCSGAFYARLRKPTSGVLSRLPSNHSFGLAIDLNANDGSLGGSVSPVAPVFEAHGFKWGKEFNDPMHFEVEEFVGSPVALSEDIAALMK
ncbi:hypothetical protein GCM10011390_21730 [Aureimonas endophytica]|uniref:Peptidase M15C domain-containing protein n=1 Tax=Aureimonas endophytica TaxID=2027858 RepID=A0A916ZKQ5_9HYPH|nr:M15 family metallopeptidase [Aureimonas endophytica]GGE02505.1 hypothetical protein GCM10011390_21730 [Aureimonas endophytica]